MKDYDALDLMHRAGMILQDMQNKDNIKWLKKYGLFRVYYTRDEWLTLDELAMELYRVGKHGGIEGGDDAGER